MTFKRAIGRPTLAQQAWQDKLREIGCICCHMLEIPQLGRTEIHHLTETGRQIGHEDVVPLCSWHHRGVCEGSKRDMRELYGPSVADGSKTFRATWGDNTQMLAMLTEVLDANA